MNVSYVFEVWSEEALLGLSYTELPQQMNKIASVTSVPTSQVSLIDDMSVAFNGDYVVNHLLAVSHYTQQSQKYCYQKW